MIARLRFPVLLVAVALVALACADEDAPRAAFTGDIAAGNPAEPTPEPREVSGEAPEEAPLDPGAAAQLQAALAATGPGCDLFDSRSCFLPFPSNAFTVEDRDTTTGVRVNFPEGQLPNAAGQPFDPTAWNLNDGFSPNTPILVHVPGLDPEQVTLPSERRISTSLTPDSSTVIVNMDTGRLVPHWAELDLRADDDADRALILRPAISLPEGTRFGVALRGLRGADGQRLEAPIGFRVLRDNLTTGEQRVEDRREQLEQMFADLADAGVNRSDLYLAWDFTVASSGSLAGGVLSMRQESFGQLAGASPAFSVDDVDTTGLRTGIERVVTGSFEVPSFLSGDGGPGSRIEVDDTTGRPVVTGTITAPFTCVVPSDGVDNGGAIPVVYGHGLLGSSNEARSSHVQVTAAELNAVYCATDWIGLSAGDVGFAVQALGDISLFPAVPDRLQQSLINTLFLGRLMLHEDGLGSDEAFQTADGGTVLNTFEAYYDGNSQGGIMGAAVTAIATDWTRAVLGVGGMNYSTLLNRSIDFDQYAVILRGAYPNQLEEQIIYGLLQMLWDRGEAGGYVQHLTDRVYELTPPKQVIMNVAFGDHQVATITADNMARTLNIPIYRPALPPGATIAAEPFFGLDPIRAFPFSGSALFYWYSGTLAPPEGNITPRMGDRFLALCTDDADSPRCADPHEDPRRQPEMIEQKRAFFQPEGDIPNICGDQPCVARQRAEFDY